MPAQAGGCFGCRGCLQYAQQRSQQTRRKERRSNKGLVPLPMFYLFPPVLAVCLSATRTIPCPGEEDRRKEVTRHCRHSTRFVPELALLGCKLDEEDIAFLNANLAITNSRPPTVDSAFDQNWAMQRDPSKRCSTLHIVTSSHFIELLSR
jgi:hypothetical protein